VVVVEVEMAEPILEYLEQLLVLQILAVEVEVQQELDQILMDKQEEVEWSF
jgi:hypothetical protein